MSFDTDQFTDDLKHYTNLLDTNRSREKETTWGFLEEAVRGITREVELRKAFTIIKNSDLDNRAAVKLLSSYRGEECSLISFLARETKSLRDWSSTLLSMIFLSRDINPRYVTQFDEVMPGYDISPRRFLANKGVRSAVLARWVKPIEKSDRRVEILEMERLESRWPSASRRLTSFDEMDSFLNDVLATPLSAYDKARRIQRACPEKFQLVHVLVCKVSNVEDGAHQVLSQLASGVRRRGYQQAWNKGAVSGKYRGMTCSEILVARCESIGVGSRKFAELRERGVNRDDYKLDSLLALGRSFDSDLTLEKFGAAQVVRVGSRYGQSGSGASHWQAAGAGGARSGSVFSGSNRGSAGVAVSFFGEGQRSPTKSPGSGSNVRWAKGPDGTKGFGELHPMAMRC